MAVLTLSYSNVTSENATVSWSISDVGSIIQVVGVANEAASGSLTAPGLVYDSSSVSGSGGSGSFTVTPSMCSSGTFGCYGFGRDGNWWYWSAGGYQSVFIPFPSSSRPENWSWRSTIVRGAPIALTAAEWTDFCSRINAFRAYKSLQQYSFTSVTRNVTPVSAAIVNQARAAIAAMSPPTSLPAVVSSGNPMTAAFFNGLKNALNSIP